MDNTEDFKDPSKKDKNESDELMEAETGIIGIFSKDLNFDKSMVLWMKKDE